MTKKLIFLFLFLGSILGSYLPLLWGDSAFSPASIVWSALGSFAGISLGYTLGKRWD